LAAYLLIDTALCPSMLSEYAALEKRRKKGKPSERIQCRWHSERKKIETFKSNVMTKKIK